MKRRLIILSIAVLCMSAVPAKADIFGFDFNALRTQWTESTGVFTADKTTGPSGTDGTVTRYAAPAGKAQFDWSVATNTAGNFNVTMALTNITATSADATGTFTITDTDPTADTIFGDITGTWKPLGGALDFSGLLSNVGYTDPVPGNFDGHSGAVVYEPPSPPWQGTLLQITAQAPWFDADTQNDFETFDVTGGSVDATIVPIPGAVLLGILGLSAAGLKLRKHA